MFKVPHPAFGHPLPHRERESSATFALASRSPRWLRGRALAGGFVIATLLWFTAPLVAEEIPSAHAKAQVARLHGLRALVAAGDVTGAVQQVVAARAEAQVAPASDPRHADGDEMQAALLAAQGKFAEARPYSERAVAARRGSPPGEQLLLCWILLQHSMVMDGAGDAPAADRALQDGIAAAGVAFAPGDPRRGQMLEAFGDLLAYGYNRPNAAVGVYEAVIKAREGKPQEARELAEVLRKAAVIEPALGRDLMADARLQTAVTLLEGELARSQTDADRRELRGDIAALLGSRTGLAARAHKFPEARQILAQMQTLAQGTDSEPYVALWSAETDRREAEDKGDLTGAIAALVRGETEARKLSQEVIRAGLQLIRGRLLVEQGNLPDAETTVLEALFTLSKAPTPEGARIAEGWLLLARIARARGDEATATRWSTGAVAMMKARRAEVPVLFATNRKARAVEATQFGSETAVSLSYGGANVLVPATAPVTNAGLSVLGGPTALERLLVTDTHVAAREGFLQSAGAAVSSAKLYPKAALVFVHGFGTTFEFALARAAQIARDVAFDGPVFVFTWPSQGRVDPRAYGADEQAAGTSVEAFRTFLDTVRAVPGLEKVHIIAHSMGNQVLLKGLGASRQPSGNSGARLGEVIFASPDVAQSTFIAETGTLHGQGMTLYASAYDKALWLSSLRNGETRAGQVLLGLLSPGQPVLARGVDSIDVSEAGRDYFNANHDVYASNPYVANDLRRLLQSGERPPERRSAGVLQVRGERPNIYWTFQPPAGR